MKLRLLLCGAALLAAGCASPQNPYTTSSELSYTYDYVPQPVPDITPAELDRIEQARVNGGGGSEYSDR